MFLDFIVILAVVHAITNEPRISATPLKSGFGLPSAMAGGRAEIIAFKIWIIEQRNF